MFSSLHPPDSLAQKTALVVDSDPEMTAALEDALANKGWMIVHAANNQVVLEMAAKRYFDVIVTDEKSPVRVDIDLLRNIRRVHPHVRLIIVANETTHDQERAARYFQKCGVARIAMQVLEQR
jgi:DNA-binding NtrC family response regulator